MGVVQSFVNTVDHKKDSYTSFSLSYLSPISRVTEVITSKEVSSNESQY